MVVDTNTKAQVLAVQAVIVNRGDVEQTNFKRVVDSIPVVLYAHTEVKTVGLEAPVGCILLEGVRYLKV